MAGRLVQDISAAHSVATLRYFLLAGRPRLEPLRVLDSRRVRWGSGTVTFCALGTSHAVLVERAGAALTELLTCASGDLRARVVRQRAASSDWSLSCTIDGLRCDCRLARLDLDGRQRLRGGFRAADRLVFGYGAEGGSEEPMTHIGWRTEDRTLAVETLHTYPHEARGVRSESVFRIL